MITKANTPAGLILLNAGVAGTEEGAGHEGSLQVFVGCSHGCGSCCDP